MQLLAEFEQIHGQKYDSAAKSRHATCSMGLSHVHTQILEFVVAHTLDHQSLVAHKHLMV